MSLLLLVAGLLGQVEPPPMPVVDPPAPVPFIRFPQPRPPAPPPMPVVPPTPAGDVVRVLHGQWYVVEGQGEFHLDAYPPEGVVIKVGTGPEKIRGVFADGTGENEAREYTAPYLAFVEPVKGYSGRVWLAATPGDRIVKNGGITKWMVDIGVAPQPPPDPDIDPTPEPTPPGPKPVPTVEGFRVIFIRDTDDNLGRTELNILNSVKIAQYLNSKCVKAADGHPEWRVWHKGLVPSQSETKTMRDLWDATKPELKEFPRILISVNGEGTLHKFPGSVDEALALLKKYGGE